MSVASDRTRGKMNLTQTGVPRPLWRLRAAVIGTIVVLTVGITAWPAAADGTAPPTAGVVSPSSTVQGRTYSQWSAAQWQWTLEQQNVTDSPVVDPNPGTAAQPEP